MEILYSQHLSTIIKQTHHIVRLPQIGPTLLGYEGYLSNFNTLTNLFYEVGNGFLDRMEGISGNIVDIMPADYVVNYMLVIAVIVLPDVVINSTTDELETASKQVVSVE